MKLVKYNLNQQTKSEIDNEIYNWFVTNKVSLFTFKYLYSCEGYIFLARLNADNFPQYVEQLLISNLNQDAEELTKVKTAFRIGPKAYSIDEFNGFIPSGISLDKTPITYLPRPRAAIAYVLAGYSEPINPNLISSWGYEAVYL